jgi:MarR family transcriptional regulator, organic hydroperoxide resistance regulator
MIQGRTAEVQELMPIAVHFAEVAVSRYSEDKVSRLKAIFREIYERLGSIEPEIEAARDSMKSTRKGSPLRPRARAKA